MESVTLTKAEYDNLTSKANQLDSLILKIEEVRNQSDGDLCMIGEVVCDELDLWL